MLKPAGYENSQGILSAAYLKDPKDPQWKNDPAMNEWRAFMTKWYPEGDQEGRPETVDREAREQPAGEQDDQRVQYEGDQAEQDQAQVKGQQEDERPAHAVLARRPLVG